MSDKATKHENFKRMANVRAGKIAKALQVLSNLASYNYEFYESEVDSLFAYINEHVAKSRAKFDARLQKSTKRTSADDDLGEDATPASPVTDLPGPSEYDIEHDEPHLPTEEPWGDDEPAGSEMELVVADGGRVISRPKG